MRNHRSDDRNKYYDESFDGDEKIITKSKFNPSITILFGIGSFIIIIWIAYYFYNNNYSNNLIVIKADTSTIKIKPQDIGGLNIPDQDKKVYESLSKKTKEENQIEKILPKPEEPINIRNLPVEDIENKLAENEIEIEPKVKEIIKLEEKPIILKKEIKIIKAKEKTKTAKISLADKLDQLAIDEEEPIKITKSFPENEKNKFKSIKVNKVSGEKYFRIQLGVFSSKRSAEEAWSKIARNAPNYLVEYGPNIEYKTINNKAIYSLQVGKFKNSDLAKKSCKSLKSVNIECWIVNS